MSEMDLQGKLEHLLHHWMEHNEGHAGEYEKWAKEAEAAGYTGAAESIKAAARVVVNANEKLQEAVKSLNIEH